MVPSNVQRNFARHYFEFPIMFADYNSKTFFDAKMYNSSTDGMYFESTYYLQPGFDIHIKKPNKMPDLDYAPEAYKTVQAKVMWCKEVELSDSSKYGIGVQFANN